MDFGVHIALADDASGSLFKVARPPRSIQVMQGNQTILAICSCAHFCSAAEQNPYIAGANFAEKLFLLHIGFGFMNKGNLFPRNPHADEFFADVVIYIKAIGRQFAGFDKRSILCGIVFYGRSFTGRR